MSLPIGKPGCGCSPDGVYWNPYNRVVQCHRCGAVHSETRRVAREVRTMFDAVRHTLRLPARKR